jgi:hypothetical protein
MITIRFESMVLHDAHRQVQAPFFRITPDCVLEGPDDRPVAQLQDGMWETGGKIFTSLKIESPVTIRFEDEEGHCSEEHGPFEQVRVVDGVIWQRPKLNELLAWIDERSHRWHVYGADVNWPAARFVDATVCSSACR